MVDLQTACDGNRQKLDAPKAGSDTLTESAMRNCQRLTSREVPSNTLGNGSTQKSAIMTIYDFPEKELALNFWCQEDCNLETWIVIGDSNVYKLQPLIKKPEGGELIVVPVSGAKVADFHGRLGWILQQAKRRLVKIVLHLGVNDMKSTKYRHRLLFQGLVTLVNEIKASSGDKLVMVFVCTLPPRSDRGREVLTQTKLANRYICSRELTTSGARFINLLRCLRYGWAQDGLHYELNAARNVAKIINWNLMHHQFR